MPSLVLVDDGFQHANTSAGGPGSTTGLPTTPAVGAANGWTDQAGSVANISGNLAVLTPTGNPTYYTDLVTRPEGSADQSVLIIYDLITDATTNCTLPAMCMRFSGSGTYYFLQFNPHDWDISLYNATFNSPSPISQIGALSMFGSFNAAHYYALFGQVISTKLTIAVFDLGATPPPQTGGIPWLGAPVGIGTYTDSNIAGTSSSHFGMVINAQSDENAVKVRRFIASNPSATSVTRPTSGTLALSATGGTDTITYTAPTAGSNPVGGMLLYQGIKPAGEIYWPLATAAGTGSGSFTNPTATAPNSTNYYTGVAYDVAFPPNISQISNEVSSPGPSVPSLFLSLTAATIANSAPMPLTANLIGSSASLTATLYGTGTISTAAPSSGTPFYYTAPSSGSGNDYIVVTDSTDNLSVLCTITYGAEDSEEWVSGYSANGSSMELGFSGVPIPGQVAVVAIATGNLAAPVVRDTQGNNYAILQGNQGSVLSVYLYAAVISSSEGPLDITAYFPPGSTNIMTMAIGRITLSTAATTTITSSTSAVNTGLSVTASCNAISFSGTGFTIGAFASTANSGGIPTLGAGYTRGVSVPYTSAVNYGLDVIYKAADTTGSATPSITYNPPGSSPTWSAIGAVITKNGVLFKVSTPYGLSTAVGIVPVPISTTTDITILGTNARWTTGMASWTPSAGSLTQTVNGPGSITIHYTATGTTGSVTLTDPTTGAAATIYVSNFWYVSPTGLDTNPGTQASPFLTPAHAVSVASANDVILLQGGHTIEIAATIAASVYLFWGSYGTGPAVLEGPNISTLIEPTNCGMSVEGLIIRGQNASQISQIVDTALLYVPITDGATHTDGLAVRNCNINNGIAAGVWLNASSSNTNKFYHVDISNCTISNMPFNGVMMHGFGATTPGGAFLGAISDFLCHGTVIRYITGFDGGIISESDSMWLSNMDATLANRCQVQFCEFSNNGIGLSLATPSTDGSGGAWWAESNGIRCRWCIGYNMGTGQLTELADCAALDIDSANYNSIIENCITWNCAGAGIETFTTNLYVGNVIRNCISIMNANVDFGHYFGGIHIDQSSYSTEGVSILNNTVIRTIGNSGNHAGISILGDGTRCRIINNLLAVLGGQFAVVSTGAIVSSLLIDYNMYISSTGNADFRDYQTSYTSLATWAAALTTAGCVNPDAHSVAGVSLGTIEPSPFVLPYPFAGATSSFIQSLAAQFALSSGSSGATAAISPSLMLSTFGTYPGTWDITGKPLASTPGAIGAVWNARPTTVYEAVSASLNPFSWWPLNEPAGTAIVRDKMASQADSSYFNATLGNTSIVPGSNWTCASFTGNVNSYAGIVMSNAMVGNPSTTAWSIEMSVDCTSNTGNLAGDWSGTGNVWNLTLGGGAISLSITDGTHTASFTSSTAPVTNNAPHHIVLTWTGSTIVGYCDGNQLTNSAGGSTTPNFVYLGGIHIGTNSGNTGAGVPGKIQHVKIYNYVLTQANVTSLFTAWSAANYGLSGSSYTINEAAVVCTVTPDVAGLADTINLTVGGVGGTATPSSLTFSNTTTPKTTSVVPSASGVATLTATSANNGLVVGSPLSITSIPTTMTAGQISVVSSGSNGWLLQANVIGGFPPLTYQWQSASAPDGTFTNVSGATSQTHTFTVAGGSPTLWVQCVVTDAESNVVTSYGWPAGAIYSGSPTWPFGVVPAMTYQVVIIGDQTLLTANNFAQSLFLSTLQAGLAPNTVTVNNQAINQSSVQGWASTNTAALISSLSTGAYVFVISLGINDSKSSGANAGESTLLPSSTYTTDLLSVCNQLLTASKFAGSVVIVEGPGWVAAPTTYNNWSDQSNTLLFAYAQDLVAIANASTIKVGYSTDRYYLFSSNPSLLSDGVSCTVAGGQALASLMASGVAGAIRGTSGTAPRVGSPFIH